ncbi:MAG: hypothetical protein V9G63_16060 [Candidatus Competibacter sp.]|nr:hypothetical protein [Candidatus Competibacteraceae bacterium]
MIQFRLIAMFSVIIASQFCVHSATALEVQPESYISGLIPSQRPANAPIIKIVQKNGSWYKKALTGIEPPYPFSLRFLEDQGNWHTPFNRPGMTGAYDIRGWHKP